LIVAACDGQFADALKRRRRLPPGRRNHRRSRPCP
jgi:hypothetical protein